MFARPQVTGPAAEILIGDAGNLINRARAGYDTQSIKLFQMATAIAGWRIQTGGWGRSLTRQQRAFAPFNLQSYQDGDLDFEISVRPLFPVVREDMGDPGQNKAMIAAAKRLLQEQD